MDRVLGADPAFSVGLMIRILSFIVKDVNEMQTYFQLQLVFLHAFNFIYMGINGAGGGGGG